MKKRVLGLPLYRWLLPAAAILASGAFYAAPGFSFSGLIFLAVAGVLLCYNAMALLAGKYPRSLKIARRIFTALLCAGLAVVTATGCLIVEASLGQPEPGLSYVVVLGCQVRQDGPSLSLYERIGAAEAYLKANPDTVCIVSGGQGPDEPMSEAQCMFEQLTTRGIPAERIWIEDRSTSTWENLVFSTALIRERTGARPETVGLVSSEYHLFRAGLLAKDCGVEIRGIPAETTWLALRINNYLREVAGVWHYLLLGGRYHD